jgi:hypothetical protein
MPIPALLPSANKSKVAVLSVIAGQMSVSEVCTPLWSPQILGL